MTIINTRVYWLRLKWTTCPGMSIVPRQCISKFTAASRGLRCYCAPLVWYFLPNDWEFLVRISHAYYTFLSIVVCKFLIFFYPVTLRPGGLTLRPYTPWQTGKPLTWDVTVVSTLAWRGEQKMSVYADLPVTSIFQPLAFDSRRHPLQRQIFTRVSIYSIARICHANSVRPSVCHTRIVPKRLNISSKFFHYLIGPSF